MEDQAIVVLVTAPDLETGREIGRILVEKKLAACANILSPVNSLFTWELSRAASAFSRTGCCQRL